jgi:nicotinate-nucleotide adenylyltransferase
VKLGMFGGAFDPPHRAHVALAQAAVAQLGLDRLLVVPTGQAWHKARALTPAPDRLAMTRLAFDALPHVEVDERELHRDGPSYTIDTLRELRAAHPAAELFLVMGEDQAQAFTRWREWEAILGIATLAVAGRPSHAATKETTTLPAHARAVRLALPSMPGSATEARELLARRQDASHLVPPAVARYIASHNLYQTC